MNQGVYEIEVRTQGQHDNPLWVSTQPALLHQCFMTSNQGRMQKGQTQMCQGSRSKYM